MPVSRRRRGRSATRAARSGNLQLNSRRKPTNKLYLAASIVIAVLVIASFGLTSIMGGGGGGKPAEGRANQYVEGIGTNFPIAGRDHVDEGTRITYDTISPTSGDHWPTPAQCDFYEDTLPNEQIVHNMEHGQIVVSYNLASESDVQALRDALNSIELYKIWGLARAYNDLQPGEINLSTWGVNDVFMGVDKDRIKQFFETYAGNLGPEQVSCLHEQSMK